MEELAKDDLANCGEYYCGGYDVFVSGFQSCHDLMKKDYDALRDENDILKNSPFCHICGSCGEGGCCNPKHCLYPDSKEERIVSLENYIKDLEINYVEKAKVQKLVEALKYYGGIDYDSDAYSDVFDCISRDSDCTTSFDDKKFSENARKALTEWNKKRGGV